MTAATAPTMHQLGQFRHLDLLALAVRRVPGTGDDTAIHYGAMSKDSLIDLLTRPQAERSAS